MQPSIGEKVIGPATPARSQQSAPPTLSPAPPTEQISDDSTTTVRKDGPHDQGGGLLIFIHRSITFSKHPSPPELLSDPHLEKLN